MDPAIVAVLQKNTKKAINTVLEIMNDPESGKSVRLQAASILLDRALGKPTQPVIGEATVHTDESPATLEEMLSMAPEVMCGDDYPGAGESDPAPGGASE